LNFAAALPAKLYFVEKENFVFGQQPAAQIAQN